MGRQIKTERKRAFWRAFFYWTMAAEKRRTGRAGTGKPESSRRKERNRRIRRGKRAGRDAGKQGKADGGKRQRGKAQGNRPMTTNEGEKGKHGRRKKKRGRRRQEKNKQNRPGKPPAKRGGEKRKIAKACADTKIQKRHRAIWRSAAEEEGESGRRTDRC